MTLPANVHSNPHAQQAVKSELNPVSNRDGMSSSSSSDTPLVASSISSLKSLMGLQLFTRLFTFILNQALFRLATPKAYGVAAIQFELMSSTILFLSREGVRGALLRVKGAVSAEKTGTPTQAAMNVGFIPIFIGIPLAIGTSLLYARFASAEAKEQGYFGWAVLLYGVAAVAELLAEPMHNKAMAELKTHVRVRAEGVGITCKTLLTFVVLVWDARRPHSDGNDLALVAFGLGQLAYGTCVFGMYLSHYYGSGLPNLKCSASTKSYFDRRILGLSMTMTSQSFVKHFLTEGDKLMLSWFSPLQDQGGYALAVNYGSLIARIVFQPIEETLRIFFSKNLAELTSNAGVAAPRNEETASATGVQVNSRNAKKPSPSVTGASNPDSDRTLSALRISSRALLSLLHIQIVASIFIVIFGSAYISLVLHVILPAQYLKTSAPKVLQAWIWYIPVLAINGGLEAFIASVGGKEDVNRQSRWMILFSLIYITAAVGLYTIGLGDSALVYANIINLSARILYAVRFCDTFFKNMQAPYTSGPPILDWKETLPDKAILGALLVSAFLGNCSKQSPLIWDLFRLPDGSRLDWSAPLEAIQQLAKWSETEEDSSRTVPTASPIPDDSLEQILTSEQIDYLLDIFSERYTPWLNFTLIRENHHDTDSMLDLVCCTVASRHLDDSARSTVTPRLQALTQNCCARLIFQSRNSSSLEAIQSLLILSLWAPVCGASEESRDARMLIGSAVSIAMNYRLNEACDKAFKMLIARQRGEMIDETAFEELMNKSRLWLSIANAESMLCVGSGRVALSKRDYDAYRMIFTIHSALSSLPSDLTAVGT
ncbi:hypothetical protein D9758_004092 [Tetrapyrgos nigripes]|uniref:Man(5)GlcNAc(2)-PP-dolichol translocation protein RFT1 n=1 Tax=Tetrapyrgos nigripes TaxID=182062 RepID=A0A8H5GUK6_9AGAR|nr:hypothetical protein D9758_004092 [Tetrapyrgos nigripes]